MTEQHRDEDRARAGSSEDRALQGSSGDRALLLIDNGPIRERAVVEVRKAMRTLNKARAEMRVLEEEDKPLFQRWYHATFAADLTRLRGLEERSEELRRRIGEIRELKKAHRLDFHEAWKMAEDMRLHPDLYEWRAADAENGNGANPYGPAADLFGWTGAGGGEDRGDGDRAERVWDDPPTEVGQLLSDAEITDLFVRFLERTTNLDPFSLEEGVYSRLLSEFKLEVLGIGVPGYGDEQAIDDPGDASPSDLKRLYRLLVRRLHPDFNPAPAERLRDAWHRMQAAYRDGDVRELELIAALCGVDSGGMTDVSSVSRLHSMRDECRERTGILLGELAEAREDPAWGFSRAVRPPGALVHSIQDGLDLDVGQASIALAALERRLRRYAEPPGARSRRREDAPDQLRFPFGA